MTVDFCYIFIYLLFLSKAIILLYSLSLAVEGCAGCGWDSVNLLHSRWYGAMFYSCAANRVGSTGMCSLWPSSAHTEPRPFLLLTPPHQPAGWGYARSRAGTQLGQLTPADPRDVPCHTASCSAYKAGGGRRKGGTSRVMALCLPKYLLSVTEPCCPGDG